MNEEYDSDHQPMIPPGKLAKSFFLVAGLYTFFIFFFVGTYLLLCFLLFPDVFKNLENPELIQQAMQADPESVLPRKLYWIWLAVNSMLCLALGWTIARLAPFARFPHAVFLAMLIFVSGLQQSIQAPQAMAWMFVLLMGALPIATLYGASFANKAMQEEEPSS